MAWVRIHDGALTHPRVVGLVDWRVPFCVWVWGLSYCQQHLTDGAIPKEAMPHPLALKTAKVLLDRGLWEQDDATFIVRDYLQHNDSREVVLAKRAGGRARVEKHRSSSVTRFTGEPVLQEKSAQSPSGVVLRSSDLATIQNQEREPERKPNSSGRNVGRLFLHRWQLDALIDTLGPLAEGFGLDEWIQGLNDSLAGRALPRNAWKWVQEQLHAEIARRNLPRVESKPANGTPVNEPGDCPHKPRCAAPGRWECVRLSQIAALKAAEGIQ